MKFSQTIIYEDMTEKYPADDRDHHDTDAVFSSITELFLSEKRLKHVKVNKNIEHNGCHIAKGEILEILNGADCGLHMKISSTGSSIYLPCYIEGDFTEYKTSRSEEDGECDCSSNYDYIHYPARSVRPRASSSGRTESTREISRSRNLMSRKKWSSCDDDTRNNNMVTSYVCMDEISKLRETQEDNDVRTQSRTEKVLKKIPVENIEYSGSDKLFENNKILFPERYVTKKYSPKVSTYTTNDVVTLLSSISLKHRVPTIREQMVNGTTLANMEEHELCAQFNFTRFEARLLFASIRGWTPVLNSTTSWVSNEHKNFSCTDLFSYLTSFGFDELARYLLGYNVDGSLFIKFLVDDMLLTLKFSDGSNLHKYELKDLQIRFPYS